MFRVKHILVVDDDLEMNGLLRDFLEREGYDVTSSYSVAGALKWLQSRPSGSLPDAVLSDVLLGNANGLELCRQISAEYPEIPVVMFSVSDMEKEALETGATEFLAKPFPLSKLSEVMARELKSRK